MPIDESDKGGCLLSTSTRRRRILVCVPRYLPGYKSGGPVRAVANMIESLGTLADFFVVTRDRDATDAERYPGITPDQWNQVGSASVLYCSSITFSKLAAAYRHAQPDVICLNSFQERITRLMVILSRIGILGKTPMILAPRGEFSPGAMEIKAAKKRLYRRFAQLAGLHNRLQWQVSSSLEKTHLLRAAPSSRLDPASIHIVAEIGEVPRAQSVERPAKGPGSLRLAFISRISEKKNVHFFLELLAKVEGMVKFDLYGPVGDGDRVYWDRCRSRIGALPRNVCAQYHGPIEHGRVAQALQSHHFFVLPTRGENYCHAAVESFLSGTPVILSDQTPWTQLYESRAGYDLPLNNRGRWMSTLQSCIAMDQSEYDLFLKGTWEYAKRFSNSVSIREHVALFESVLSPAQ